MKINKLNKIPKGTPYCYNSDQLCPYLKEKMTDYGYGGRKNKEKYCKYLHIYLSIQDEVKDCGIEQEDL